MKDPRTLSIKDFTYHLPEEKIANYPLPDRDASKLLIYKAGNISEDIYRNIADHIPEDSLLIFNDTKVVEARLLFQKATGGIIEIFCLEPDDQYPDITTAMHQYEKVFWKCFIGGASKWKKNQLLEKKIELADRIMILTAKYIDKKADSFKIELSWNDPQISFSEMLHLGGNIPLPPYIKRNVEADDSVRYQTIYAHHDGSVAAPTAGLHFTDTIFEKLIEKNIQKDFVTLHVGAGTFKPVKSDLMEGHEMHEEYFLVKKSIIINLINHADKNIIAVGTTSLRTIESLYWLGVKLSLDSGLNTIELTQWEAYELDKHKISIIDSLQSLLSWMEKNKMDQLAAKTQIIIAPGYKFRMVNGLITNFHQPQSTLILLVAAVAGNNWKEIYTYALNRNFRFLSYGDGSLLWVNRG